MPMELKQLRVETETFKSIYCQMKFRNDGKNVYKNIFFPGVL